MNCPDIEAIERFIANDLQPEKLAEFEAHVQDCDRCQAALVEANSNEECLADLKATRGPTLDRPSSSRFNSGDPLRYPASRTHSPCWASATT